MRDSPVNSSANKQLLQDECCDLYGEYCYPCNTTATAAGHKDGEKKPVKGKKRHSD